MLINILMLLVASSEAFFFLRTHAKVFKVFFGIFVVYHQLLSDSRPE